VSVYKIVYAVGLLLAVVAAFVTNTYFPLVLALCGAVAGYSITADTHVRVIVSALALHFLANSFDGLPGAGHYITSIIGNLGTVAGGAALVIILRNIIARLQN